MLKYEMMKIWTKKSFLVLLIASLFINLFMLWYTNSNMQNDSIPLQSYRLLQMDMQHLSPDEKKQLITDVFEYWYAYDIIEQIKMYESDNGSISENAATQLKEEHQELITKFESSKRN